MRQNLYKRLAELERIDAAARDAEARRTAPSGAEVLGKFLSQHGIKTIAGESLAETTARAFGISARELKHILEERAQAIAP